MVCPTTHFEYNTNPYKPKSSILQPFHPPQVENQLNANELHLENDVSMEMTTVLPAMLPAATADETTVLPALGDLDKR